MRQHAANQTLVRIPNYLIIFGKLTRIKAATGGVLQSCKPNLLKKSLWDSCFPVNFAKFLRTFFLQNTSGRLLLTGRKLNVHKTFKRLRGTPSYSIRLIYVLCPRGKKDTRAKWAKICPKLINKVCRKTFKNIALMSLNNYLFIEKKYHNLFNVRNKEN